MFFKTVDTLKKRLGPVLFQLPPNFKKDVPRLQASSSPSSSPTPCGDGVRHSSWFDNEVFGLLRKHQTAPASRTRRTT